MHGTYCTYTWRAVLYLPGRCASPVAEQAHAAPGCEPAQAPALDGMRVRVTVPGPCTVNYTDVMFQPVTI